MRRSRAFLLVLIVAVLTALGPLIAVLYLARMQGLEIELARVVSYAHNVVDRSDRAVAQMQEALTMLASSNPDAPCSADVIALMRDIGLRFEYMKLAGHVSDGRLKCSTLGDHGDGLMLGPVELVTSTGTRIRQMAPIPFARDIAYVSLERDGFIAMAPRGQAVDIVVDQQGVLFATFNPITREMRTTSGEVDPAWIGAVDHTDSAAFLDGGYIIGVVKSSEVAETGAIAAIPIRYLNERIRELIVALLPIALIMGGGLTGSFLYLARMQSSLSSQIRQGLKRQEFFLLYQPVVDLQTGRWVGAEALLRWRRRDGEIVYPDAFIPIAEQTGVISQLTARVISLVQRDMTQILQRHPEFGLSLNLSARDLESPETLDSLLAWIKQAGINPGQLTVELTERMLVDQESAGHLIASMRQHGIEVAIDDFGTGYCSLSYLETMQFDSLKIDRLFVEAIDTDAATNRVVQHIIEMAATLGLKLVAEGVETVDQANYLREHGVRSAQGWLYSKAVSESEIDEFLGRG
jgi:sensor c-di-GMP phosphodiesterase-like protein